FSVSWKINLKMTKVVRKVIDRIMSNNPLLLPLNLRNQIHLLGPVVGTLDQHSQDYINLIESYFNTVLEEAQRCNQMTLRQYGIAIIELNRWKNA
ncbi:MAG: hypothetical protein ACREBA_11680, partial [Nitrosotalea sp.]